MNTGLRQIRALFTDETVRVYQAFSHAIADAAVQSGTFMPPLFKMNRMTWIKPSFLWMMHRSSWASKPNQERVLAIDVSRDGFDWALKHAVLSSFCPNIHPSACKWSETLRDSIVRVQWDPDRDTHMKRLERRTIQIGLRDQALEKYVKEWIVGIKDITKEVRYIHRLIATGQQEKATTSLPQEVLYPVTTEVAVYLGIDAEEDR